MDIQELERKLANLEALLREAREYVAEAVNEYGAGGGRGEFLKRIDEALSPSAPPAV